MPIDQAYGEFADFLNNNPSKLANLQAATRLNSANAQAQQLANQQAQQALQNQQSFNQILGSLNQSHLSGLQQGSVGIGQPAPQVNVPSGQDLPVAAPRVPASMPEGVVDNGSTPLPAATAQPEAPQPIAVAAAQRDPTDPNNISNSDPNLIASKQGMLNRTSPDGTIRTPEGMVVRAGSGADSYDAATPQPIAAQTQTVAPTTPFAAELVKQNAQKQQIRQAYQSLADDPSSWTRDVGGQLLSDPRVQASPQLTQMAINWIQQRQAADSKAKEAKATASTAALKAEAENLSRANEHARTWYTAAQTEAQRAAGWPQEAAALVRKGFVKQEDVDQIPNYPGDAAWPAVLAHLTNTHELASQILKERKEGAEAGKSETETAEYNSPAAVAARKAKDAETVANSKKSEAVLADYLSPAATAARKAIDEEAVTKAKVASAEADAKVAVAADTLADRNHLTPEQRQQAKQEQQKLLAQDMNVQLTPAALDKLAEMFATTGQLPALGNGPKATATRIKVVDKATENYPAVQFATNRAVFDANKSTLAKLSAQKELSEAFAQTAGKNLDTFLSTAKNVVDKGVPWINTPLRAVADKALGSEDQAAFKTARFVALSEIARVLTASPSGGGVVSDRARQEAEELIGPDATLKQVYKAATILQTDMKNRLESYDQSVKLVQGRIADMLKAQQPAVGTKIVVTAPDGSTHPFDTQAQADAFKKLANIK